jgi:hypothetical protein
LDFVINFEIIMNTRVLAALVSLDVRLMLMLDTFSVPLPDVSSRRGFIIHKFQRGCIGDFGSGGMIDGIAASILIEIKLPHLCCADLRNGLIVRHPPVITFL